MRERGSALLTSVIAIMVLLMISGVMFTFVNYKFKLETSEEKGLKAFYMAEAGINYGVAMVRQNPEAFFIENSPYLKEPDLTTKTNPLVTKSNLFEAEEKGEFQVFLQIHPSEKNYTFTVTSFGNYPDQNGIERVLEQQYTYPKPEQAQP